MKKSLLVIAMSLIMGGLVISPNDTTIANAEEKLLSPDKAVKDLPHAPLFEAEGNLRYPWEMLNGSYNGVGPKVVDIATMDIAFFPTSTGFIEGAEYAIVNVPGASVMSSSEIIGALKSVWAQPGAYSPAFRYVSKTADYTNSDWYVMNDISYNYEFNYKLSITCSDTNTQWYVKEDTGELVWQWQILNAHPEKEEVECLQILVFDENTTSIDDTTVPLTTFEIRDGHPQIYKNEIENYLTAANLKHGKYKFSARVIAKEGSHYENSDLYPLVGGNYEYTPIELSSINIAKNKTAYASSYSGGDTPNNAIDGQRGTRWINGNMNDEHAWLIVDLGEKFYLSSMNVIWETAGAKDYDIYVEKNINVDTFTEETLATMTPVKRFTDLKSENNRTETIELNNMSGRYIIISCLARATQWDYSIYEVEAYQNADLTEVEKLVIDWKDLRASANGNICAVKDSEEMMRLLSVYDSLSDEDKLILENTDDAMGVSIADTIRYIKDINGLNADNNSEGTLSNALLNTMVKDETSVLAIVAIVSIVAITVAYYAIKRRKYNN